MAFVGEKYSQRRTWEGAAMRQQWRGKEKINFRVTNPRCDERRKQASREDERMRALQQQADGRTDGQKDGWTKRERKQDKRRYARVRRLAATATMTTACLLQLAAAAGAAATHHPSLHLKRAERKQGYRSRSNQCCRMLANPNITNPNSHLDPRNPQFPSKQCRKREGARQEENFSFF